MPIKLQPKSSARSFSPLWRGCRWLLSGEWRPALLMGIVFVLYILVQLGNFGSLLAEPKLLPTVTSLMIFGVFVGVVFVTELGSQPEAVVTRKCVTSGCIACSAIAFIVGAPVEGVALGALVGAFLGYTARWWAQGI